MGVTHSAPRVLLFASPTSYRIAAYREAAGRLGIDMLVAAEGRHALISEIADGLRVELDSPDGVLDRVLEEARRRPFSGVVATDDGTVELATRAAAALGMPHNPLAAVRASRRKDWARERLRAAGVPVPGFRRVDLREQLRPQLDGVRFPCVVKPLALAGSRGVIRADDADALVAACRRIESIVATLSDDEEGRFLLVEDYIPGVEAALEGILRAGVLKVLAIFDKPDPLEGPFFEETYYVTPSSLSSATQRQVRARVAEACAAYGLREGPIHAELRINGDGVWILEIAARTIGGDCARLLRFGTGRSLEEIVLAHAIGGDVSIERAAGAAGVLMIPTGRAGCLRRVEGVLAARRVPLVEDVVISVREGYELVPLPEGSSYLGFIFARGPTAGAVEAALRRAHGCLRVVVAPSWKLHPPSDAITSSRRELETPREDLRTRPPRRRSPACASR